MLLFGFVINLLRFCMGLFSYWYTDMLEHNYHHPLVFPFPFPMHPCPPPTHPQFYQKEESWLVSAAMLEAHRESFCVHYIWLMFACAVVGAYGIAYTHWFKHCMTDWLISWCVRIPWCFALPPTGQICDVGEKSPYYHNDR